MAAARLADHRVLVWACLVLVLVGVFYVNMLPISNQDIGWHLALGRHFVETGSVATTEPLSHTARGAPMVAHEWLAEVLYYMISQTVGLLGLRCVNAAMAAAFLVLLYLLLRREAVRPALALSGALLYLLVAQTRFELRPQVFSTFFLAGLYVYTFRVRPALTARQLAVVFATVVLWANTHSGVVLYAMLVVMYVAVECLLRASGVKRQQEVTALGEGKPGRLVALAVTVLAGVLLTPNHFHLIPYVLESKRINAVSSREWVSITQYWGSSLMKPFAVETYWVLTAGVILTALVNFRRYRPSELAVVGFVTALPLNGFRFVDSMFIPILFTMEALSRWTAVSPALPRRKVELVRQAALLAALILPLAAVYPALSKDLKRFNNRISAEWNFRTANFPVGAVDFLDAVDLQGKLFNPSEWGGYLLYRTFRKYPVFIDGRWIDYGERIFDDSQTIRWRNPGAFDKLDQYDIDILLVPREFITADLPQRQNWIPVFEHFSAGVYLRNHPRNAKNLQKCAEYYRSRNIPFDLTEGFQERNAVVANPQWAEQHNVRRQHLDLRLQKQVAGW